MKSGELAPELMINLKRALPISERRNKTKAYAVRTRIRGGGAVVVDLGGAEPAGCLAEAGSRCRGRTHSTSLGSVAVRRTASATIYMLERRSLPGGWRYGGAAVA